MHLQNVLNVQGQEGAGVPRKLYVDVHLELLSQVFLVNDEVTIYFGRGEVDY